LRPSLTMAGAPSLSCIVDFATQSLGSIRRVGPHRRSRTHRTT
jgi:hypothetical protein